MAIVFQPFFKKLSMYTVHSSIGQKSGSADLRQVQLISAWCIHAPVISWRVSKWLAGL